MNYPPQYTSSLVYLHNLHNTFLNKAIAYHRCGVKVYIIVTLDFRWCGAGRVVKRCVDYVEYTIGDRCGFGVFEGRKYLRIARYAIGGGWGEIIIYVKKVGAYCSECYSCEGCKYFVHREVVWMR